MPTARKNKASTAKVVSALRKLSIRPRPRQPARKPTRRMNASVVKRRPSQKIPRISAPCVIKDVERLTTIVVPTATTAGQLLYNIAANPMACPRLSATASQFDSWYGTMHMEVETTGNAFSKDFVVIRHVANGDPSRIPTVANVLLNLAETSERRGEQARLQLDCNKRASVSAIWSESYNPRKPIIDSDPTECNLGQFIIVSNGSPGTDPVSLVVRMRYIVHFFSPIYTPWVVDTSRVITAAGGGISSANVFGNSPTYSGNGSQLVTTGNSVNFPLAGNYTINFYQSGGTITAAPTASSSPAVTFTPYSAMFNSGSSTSNWDITTTAANTVVTFVVTGTTTASRLEISPN